MTSADLNPVETVLRDELARADRVLGGVAPVLSHILASSGDPLVSDAIVARVRGMLTDIARQLIHRVPDQVEWLDELVENLAADPRLLIFVHSVAMEAILTERLEQRASIDPVLSPLLQELIASEDPQTSETAMQALAAQSRFMQSQRRMQFPTGEFPPDVLERALGIFAQTLPVDYDSDITAAVRAIKADYDEARSRIGLLARLVIAMRGAAIAALELEHAGFALFVSALAHLAGQDRERSVVACHARQAARLTLALRAAGLGSVAIKKQLVALEPTARLPRELSDFSVEAARAMLHEANNGSLEMGMR